MFAADASYVKKADRRRQALLAQRAALRAKGEIPTPAPLSGGPTGIDDIGDEDRVRVKLRQMVRIGGRGNSPVNKLTTLADVHSLSFATRFIEGGRNAFIEFVQGAMLEELPSATAWFSVYADLLPYERKIASLDDICAAAGVKPSKLMAEIVTMVMERGRDVGNLVAAAMHPEVVHAMAKSAATINGMNAEINHKDRMAFLQGQGMLPVPKGASISIHASANAAAAAAAAQEPSMPSFVGDMRAVTSARVAGQKALAAAPVVESFEWVPPVRETVAAPIADGELISPDPPEDEG